MATAGAQGGDMDVWGGVPCPSFVRGDSLGRAIQEFTASPGADFVGGGDELTAGGTLVGTLDNGLYQPIPTELEGAYGGVPVMDGREYVLARDAPMDFLTVSAPEQDPVTLGSMAGMVASAGVHPVRLSPAQMMPQYSMLHPQIVPGAVPQSDPHANAHEVVSHAPVAMYSDSPSNVSEPLLRGKPIDYPPSVQLKSHEGMDTPSPQSGNRVISGTPISLGLPTGHLTQQPTAADSTASGNTVIMSRVVESPTAQTTPALSRPRRQASQRNNPLGVRGGDVSSRRRSSRFRGVTKHRRSGRWEAHIWIKDIGRQVYLGGYEIEEHAAEAYDVAALKCKGRRVKTNFEITRYADLLKCMDSISLEELIMAVRRQSQGFSRGTSSYRGVTHHPSGRWESRIGIPGSKHIYLGLYDDEKEAARQYDRALVRLRGTAAATNFALSDYREELAEYHQMQQAVLLGDASAEAAMRSGPNFEHWIKFGSKGSTLLQSNSGSPALNNNTPQNVESEETAGRKDVKPDMGSSKSEEDLQPSC